jgi:hypothetical protein
MTQLLEKVSRESFYVPQNIYASDVRVAYFDSLLQKAPVHQKNQYLLQKAINLLFGGRTAESIVILQSLLELKTKARFVDGLEPYEEDGLESYWLWLT